MTFQQSLPYQFQGFRQTLTPEQIIRTQIENCVKAIADNDRDAVESGVNALTALVTEEMIDDDFLKAMKEVEADWRVVVAQRQKQYKRELAEADGGCPDVVPLPSQKPDMATLTKSFRALLNLFERKKMWLKPVVEDSV